ncbi:uncharacterized protein DUF1540 [Herbinix hemicellulosilytica]|uniref:DUF1540 domain-containing protein n=1 Tax=Herbinix hemicellulosilytica TaxID=1564487 RepID=A0A0H5SEW3_HERHM|nr:DUF1540 domain-containing protein [Herbinix hemicellulosilytica]RBP60303.1 uncharacterized protein DUF1540 [Herbinix hemicellulosilytica]CRZ33555.1 hypothetical protein HHT355_0347 [Herbinix hemicellulosilytica]
MAIKKMDKPNEGVRCVVNTCEYYMAGDHCAAEQIQVEPRNASDSEDTDCATFVKKSDSFS